jgi:hypothetical protein
MAVYLLEDPRTEESDQMHEKSSKAGGVRFKMEGNTLEGLWDLCGVLGPGRRHHEEKNIRGLR